MFVKSFKYLIILLVVSIFLSCALSDKMNSIPMKIASSTYFLDDTLLISGNIIGELDWDSDNEKLVFSLGGIIFSLDVKTKTPRQMTFDNIGRSNPKWSSDGEHILCDGNGIWILKTNGGNSTKIAEGNNPKWSPDETKVLYSSIFSLYVAEINSDMEMITSNPVGASGGGIIGFWSPIENKLAFNSIRSEQIFGDDWVSLKSFVRLHTVHSDGNNLINLDSPGIYPNDEFQDWSPDGYKILITSAYLLNTNDPKHIWVIDLDNNTQSKLTSGSHNNFHARFSPDGKKIIFISDRNGANDIWMMNAGGSGQEPIVSSLGDETSLTWSPDSSMLAYRVGNELRVLRR